ncbi:hypothetical protein Tcan_07097 [Toxocara canis]|uniref:Uncharacterized protein n=1 Tax=Toxocara canis TaxID=6265 RepID=A0A0B2VVL1_TOXCA|nr:hypothetical protein Tcan_07097 [Toxocara canis]
MWFLKIHSADVENEPFSDPSSKSLHLPILRRPLIAPVHRPTTAFLDELDRKRSHMSSNKTATVISDVFYKCDLFTDLKFGRSNLEQEVCQLLNQRYSEEVACAYKILIFNQGTMNDEGVAIALLKRHLSRVIGDAENRKYHMLACSNANVAKILELRYAEEALALFGYNREKQSRGFVFVADEKRLLQSLEQMRSFVSVLDCDQNSVILKLDRSLSLVNPEKASREHFLNSHLPASFYTFKTPSQVMLPLFFLRLLQKCQEEIRCRW